MGAVCLAACACVSHLQDRDALRGHRDHRHGSREHSGALPSPRPGGSSSSKDAAKPAGDSAAAPAAGKAEEGKAAEAEGASEDKQAAAEVKDEAAMTGDKAVAAAGDTEGGDKSEAGQQDQAQEELKASDPETWPQPEAGEVVDGVKWMAKVCGTWRVSRFWALLCGYGSHSSPSMTESVTWLLLAVLGRSDTQHMQTMQPKLCTTCQGVVVLVRVSPSNGHHCQGNTLKVCLSCCVVQNLPHLRTNLHVMLHRRLTGWPPLISSSATATAARIIL